jgi:hypothetical protein
MKKYISKILILLAFVSLGALHAFADVSAAPTTASACSSITLSTTLTDPADNSMLWLYSTADESDPIAQGGVAPNGWATNGLCDGSSFTWLADGSPLSTLPDGNYVLVEAAQHLYIGHGTVTNGDCHTYGAVSLTACEADVSFQNAVDITIGSGGGGGGSSHTFSTVDGASVLTASVGNLSDQIGAEIVPLLEMLFALIGLGCAIYYVYRFISRRA